MADSHAARIIAQPLNRPDSNGNVALEPLDFDDAVAISSGEYTAEFSTVGAALRGLTFQEKDLVAPFPRGMKAPLTAGQFLAPWPSRVTDGRYVHDSEAFQLPITDEERHAALHGFVRSFVWDVAEHTESSVIFHLDTPAQPGYPWPIEYTVRWDLSARSGLACTFTVVNHGEARVPFAWGFHSYLIAQGAPLDETIVTLPVSTNVPLDPQRSVPAGPVQSSDVVMPGLSSGVPMRGVWQDHTYGGVSLGADGCVHARLTQQEDPQTGVELWAGSWARWLQVFTASPEHGSGFPGLGRVLAVEPESAHGDAFRSGEDLLYVTPHDELQFTFGIRALGEGSASHAEK
ncbi:MAG: hypothetical protein SPI12_04475 [Actinomycetaceae bacterium]|nr:hypothetical protein [Actinomycetaceae bacterium]MDY6083100.1 hypothetical protein [Actinomycetaceae bacterium]